MLASGLVVKICLGECFVQEYQVRIIGCREGFDVEGCFLESPEGL